MNRSRRAGLRRARATLVLLAWVPWSRATSMSAGQGTLADAPLCSTRAASGPSPSTGGDELSVGVTYFAGRSSTGDDAHLAAALSTEVVHQLLSARIVDPAASAGTIPRMLVVKLSGGDGLADVDLSMTGSVFRDGTLLRTSARVTRTSDGTVLWSGNRARPILELPIIARLIAQEVATRIGARLTSPAPPAAVERSAETYELILQGANMRSRYDPDDLVRSIEFFDQALEREPASTHARELRRGAQLRLLAWGGKGSGLETRMLAQGLLRRIGDRDREESERLIEEADEELRGGQPAHACQLLNAAIDNDTRAAPAYAIRSLIRARGGELREAFADAEIVTQLGRPLWGNALRAMALFRAGDVASAHSLTRELVAQTRQRRGALPFWDARFVASALAETGDWPGSQSILRRIDPRDVRIAWLASDPSLHAPKPAQRPLRRTR